MFATTKIIPISIGFLKIFKINLPFEVVISFTIHFFYLHQNFDPNAKKYNPSDIHHHHCVGKQ